jgi:hypothetical protein
MTDPVTTFSKGGGAVRYRVTSTPMLVHACRCSLCRLDALCAKSSVPYPKDGAGPAAPVSPPHYTSEGPLQ